MNVLVTGAAAGLGQALTRQLVKEGHMVVGIDAVSIGLEKLEREFPGKVRTLLCDVTDEAELQKARDRLQEDELPEVVINNAAIGRYADMATITAEQWRRQIDVNLTGPFLVTKTFLADLQRASGKLINIGSTRASTPAKEYSCYCASKFGLRGFSLCVSQELAPQVATTIIEIGPMLTDFGNRLEQRRQEQQQGVPMLLPEEVAGVIADLITGKRAWSDEVSILATVQGLTVS